ncbi:hypothetical protein FRB90_009994 [Tulasnella sp. 427]|nr:hypothetical protein FRB90_009994 [Tulasnella sp. 427]
MASVPAVGGLPVDGGVVRSDSPKASAFIYDPTAGIIKSQKVVGYGSTLTIPQEVLPPVKRTGPPIRYQLFGDCQASVGSPAVDNSDDNHGPKSSSSQSDSPPCQVRVDVWRSRTRLTPAHQFETEHYMRYQPLAASQSTKKTSEGSTKTPADSRTSGTPKDTKTPVDAEPPTKPQPSDDSQPAAKDLGDEWQALGHQMLKLALSNATDEDFEKMGFLPYSIIELSIKDMLLAFMDALEAAGLGQSDIEKFEARASVAAEAIIAKYIIWAEDLFGDNEACARLFINSVLEIILPLCRSIQFKEGTGKTLLTLELATPREVKTIPSTTADPTSACLELMDGKSDYTTFFVPGWHKILKPSQLRLERFLRSIKSVPKDHFNAKPTATDENSAWTKYLQTVCVTVYEAKKFEITSDAALPKERPQAIAEALVLGHRLQQAYDSEDKRHRVIPAILTDGSRWIFTLWQPDFEVGSLGRWQGFQSAVHKLDGSVQLFPSNRHRPDTVRSFQELVHLLVFWNTIQRGDIISSMIKVMEAKGK